MDETKEYPLNDPYGSIADILFGYLYNIIYNPATASLDVEELPESCRKFGRGLQFFCNSVTEMRTLAKELAVGNLNCALPQPSNEIASSLKMLHSSLKHLTWQTQQVAKGDYNQRINFMGDFSSAFNNMIEQLDEQRKIHRDERIKLEMYMQLILENCPDPILLFDSEGKLAFLSNSYFKYCKNATLNELLGKRIHDVFAPVVPELSLGKMEQLYNSVFLEKRTYGAEQDIDFGNHDFQCHFKVQILPFFDSGGNTAGMIMFLSDITESIQARLEAEHARELAERASNSKSSFLANMSHEIRTPLNAIIGMAELALREEIPLTAREHTAAIRQAGMSLLSIINDILDISKIEAGRLEIIPGDYLFSSLLVDVINIIKTRMLESRLRFVVNLDGNIPNALFGDPARIRQILLNLLNNAIKYTEKGFMSLSVYGTIADNEIVYLTMEISDSGRGIKQEDLEGLFEEFKRLDLENNKYIEGTGLGLAIARNLVMAMGGTIDVHSEYGKGSTFTIRLPQKIRNDQKLAVVENQSEKSVLIYERREICVNSIVSTMENLGVNYKLVSTSSEFYDCLQSKKYSFVFLSSTLYENVKKEYPGINSDAKFALIAEFGEAVAERNISVMTMPIFSIPVANFLNGISDNITCFYDRGVFVKFVMPEANVLIVDDISSNLKVASGLLLPYRAQIKLCKSGMEAIDAVKATRFDLVFMDHMMPDMDGVETLLKIREYGSEDPHYKSVPIVVLTADAVFGTREMLLSKGFNDFLSKPIDTLKLNAVLERWIPKEKQMRAAAEVSKIFEAPEYNLGEINIQGLNVKKGLSLTGGTMENYIEILSTFSRDGIEKIEQLKICLVTNNVPLYVVYVHALKNAAAVIGAEELSKTAEGLEKAGKQGNKNLIYTGSAALIADLEFLLDNINVFLSARTAETKVGLMDEEVLKTALSALRTALSTYDFSEINEISGSLQNFTQAPDIGDTIRVLLEKRLIGEYDEALSMIDTLLQSIQS